MSCEKIREILPLYTYGELSFDDEETVDRHLQSCAACTAERDVLLRLHDALDTSVAEPSLELLSACRQNLKREVALLAAANPRRPFWAAWLPEPGTSWTAWAAKPAMALGLMAVGFLGARFVPPAVPSTAPAPPLARNVRLIEPAGDGRVRIVYEEVRQRELDGGVDDKGVRDMLLAATRDPSDPALRVDSVEYLKDRVEREEVRKALVRSLTSDSNEGVRLKALEALKPHSGTEDVRAALTRVLLSDQSAAVRTHAIDLLVSSRQDEAELAGTLQMLLGREQNSYIRQRSQSALRAMNASLETF